MTDSTSHLSTAGYRGSVRGFLDWISEHLSYGEVRISEPLTADSGTEVIRVEMVTGGYSSDEELLDRVWNSVFGSLTWRSSHRGGLYVYEVPTAWTGDDGSWSDMMWLEPGGQAAAYSSACARVQVQRPGGGLVDVPFGGAAKVVVGGDGVITVQPHRTPLTAVPGSTHHLRGLDQPPDTRIEHV